MRTLLLALLALALLPANALAKTETASRGDVTATFSYKGKGLQLSDQRLVIVRDGVTALDAAPESTRCDPDAEYGCSAPSGDPLRVRDLDGDGEPEVLLELYTGGAHCCFQALVYRFDGSSYELFERDFGDVGFKLRDLDDDGVPEFRSADPAFAYAFSSYAFSGFPVQVLRLRGDVLLDVTGRFPALVRKDARFWWRTYRRALRERPSEPRGLIAAWAADRYRLGEVAATRRTLRREARRGNLDQKGAGSPQRFLRRLDRFLNRAGYR